MVLAVRRDTIVFRSRSRLCLWSPGQAAAFLAEASGVERATISDDGEVIAFVRPVDDLHAELWAVNRDGAGERRLMSADEFTALDPTADGILPYQIGWQPGTHRLVFNTQMAGYGLILYDDLHRVDADTLEHIRLLPPGAGGMFRFSPDGSLMALVTPTAISLADADGSAPRGPALTFPEVSTASEYRYYPGPVWAGDSRSLRIALPSPEPFAPDAALSLWHIPVDGSAAAQLTVFSTGPRPPQTAAVFSPDLSYIAFLALGPGSSSSLYLARVDGSPAAVYVSGDLGADLAWEADSRYFTLVLGGVLQRGEIGGPFGPAPTPAPSASGPPMEAGC